MEDKTAYTEVTSGRKPEVSTDCSLALFSFCNHVTTPQNLSSQSGACMPCNQTTPDVHVSPFLHVLLIQRLHRCKAILRPSKRPRFRLTKICCVRGYEVRAPCCHTERMRVPGEVLVVLEALQYQQEWISLCVCNGVRCGCCRVCWSAAAALLSSHSSLLQEAGAPRAHVHPLGKKRSTDELLSLQWTSTMLCAQAGSVTGTEIVNTGTGQSHATGPAGTAETATVVIMTAEKDHADMTGTIGMQLLLPTDHSEDVCRFSCL